MLCKFNSSPRERLIIARKANQWKGTYHPWLLSSRAKNCATKPIPRQNIRFRDFGSDGSVSERESSAAAIIRDKNGDVWDLGRPRFLGTWPNLRGVADIRPGMWHISIGRYCSLYIIIQVSGRNIELLKRVECIQPLQPPVPPLSSIGSGRLQVLLAQDQPILGRRIHMSFHHMPPYELSSHALEHS